MRQSSALWVALLAIVGLLSACGGKSAPTAELPLAGSKPTFLYFFTDN